MKDDTSITVYAATLYHDSPDEAADDWRHLGYFPTLLVATRMVNAARGKEPGWDTGDVQRGDLHPAVFGIRPEYFEGHDDAVWFVGLDGQPVR